jgi:conjugal transfer pilus assembly protein TraE
MNSEFFYQDMPKFISQRNGLLVLAGLLAFNNIVLSGAFVFSSEKTIILPPEVRKSFWVKGGEVSKEYLEDMGWGLSKLLLDLTPSNYPYNHEKLLTFAAPEAYGRLKKKLLKEGEQYKSLQLSTHFYPSEILADPKTLSVSVKGTLSSFVAGKLVDTVEETVHLTLQQRGGGLLLESIMGSNIGESPDDL